MIRAGAPGYQRVQLSLTPPWRGGETIHRIGDDSSQGATANCS
jgi:hypothetical protein